MTTHHQFEALVVGAGGAGLMAALHCSRTVKSTAVISKLYPTRSHTGTARTLSGVQRSRSARAVQSKDA